MLVEPLVLIGDQHLEEERIDVAERHRQPPAAVGGGEGPEQLAVAIDDQSAENSKVAAQRWRRRRR